MIKCVYTVGPWRYEHQSYELSLGKLPWGGSLVILKPSPSQTAAFTVKGAQLIPMTKAMKPFQWLLYTGAPKT